MPAASLKFPSPGLQALSAVVHFLGISILCLCLSHRLVSGTLRWKQISWARLCIIIVFLDSWLFLFTSGVLIFGVGLEWDPTVCRGAIYICIVFYSTSKLLIYAFLTERVYVVWAPATGVKRFHCRVYVIALVTVSLYGAVMALMLGGRIYYIRPEDETCVIGLRGFASIPLLSYDVYINVFLTTLFVIPLFKSAQVNASNRMTTLRALTASSVSLSISVANMAILTGLHGQELGWICLSSCAADVVGNALALSFFTSASPSSKDRLQTRQLPLNETPRLGSHTYQLPDIHSHPNADYYPSAHRMASDIHNEVIYPAISMRSIPGPDRESIIDNFSPSPYYAPKKQYESDMTIDRRPLENNGKSTLQSLRGLFRSERVSPQKEVTQKDVKITVITEFEVDGDRDWDKYRSQREPDSRSLP